MEYTIHNGFVRLDNYSANDLDVVNGARVSFGKKSTYLSEADVRLIYFLMTNKHATPFEHTFFKFHIKCPIFVAREWFRHRIGSFNEMSMRYHQPDLEYFIPKPEDFRTQVGKPGNYTFEPMDNTTGICDFMHTRMRDVCEEAEATYLALIEAGVAKELARVILPVGTYTEFIWSINARSLINFISLRNDDAAQKEIRDYAEKIEEIFSKIMPVTYNAFEANGRIAI